ncbi:hypothetical protein [Nitriliruptor alkaliphilus]|uniref:hypothetical protein n=1 Tax=Nitriliruptor alkaliphilus TaxID=427918 RepID=UPI0006983BC2|nr:hypothetical protein [Nitriliruptor alkaliphilus]
MSVSDGVTVVCASCGPTVVDPALVELHRDRVRGFTLVTYLCLGCGELGASRCPEVVAGSERAAVPERTLTCTSPPQVPGA